MDDIDNIELGTGIKHIRINHDSARVIKFDPNDIVFAERFYALIAELEQKRLEYHERAAELERGAALDANGLPGNVGESLALLHDMCVFMRGRIDAVFGDGTSQTAFGDTLNLDVIAEFFTGVTPFIRSARAAKIAPYVNPKTAVRDRHAKHNTKRRQK